MSGWATAVRTALRTVVCFVLYGLFAMHGLPDAMATPAQGMPLPAVVAHHTAAGSAGDVIDRPPPGRDRRAPMTQAHHRLPGPDGSTAGGCAFDHAGCVAVLRDTYLPSASALPALDTHAASAVTGRGLRVFGATTRAPPEVSLVELGISRT